MNIAEYRRDFAAYHSANEFAHYEYRAGLAPELRAEPIHERYGHLFTREAVDDLRQAFDETPAHMETERAGLRALLGAARAGFLDVRAKELTEERARCERAAAVEWGGEKVPAHGVPQLLANEDSRERRRELTARWLDALKSCDDLRAARFESFHESARALGFDSYRALFADVTGVDFEKLSEAAELLLRRTESAYMSALAEVASRELPGVALNDLGHADFFRFERLSRLDSIFPARDLLPTHAEAIGGLGLRAETQGRIHIDAEPRPFKHPRAACFRIKPPQDVRLLLAPAGGANDYRTLLHEGGHAQHFAWVSPELTRRHPEFVYAPDYSTTEGYAFLFQSWLLDPAWLAEYRGGIRASDARDAARTLAVLTAHGVRRLAAKLKYEIALHDGTDLRSDALADLYARSQTEATGFRRDASLRLYDVDDEFYVASYLRAWAFAASLGEYLRERHGRRWWASRRAGDELVDFWNTASRYSVEELARQIGFREISFELLADNLTKALRDE